MRKSCTIPSSVSLRLCTSDYFPKISLIWTLLLPALIHVSILPWWEQGEFSQNGSELPAKETNRIFWGQLDFHSGELPPNLPPESAAVAGRHRTSLRLSSTHCSRADFLGSWCTKDEYFEPEFCKSARILPALNTVISPEVGAPQGAQRNTPQASA